MSKPLTTYDVTFIDTLRVVVTVQAAYPEQARRRATHRWCADLWDKADVALLDVASEIIESDNRTCLSIVSHPETSTNESQPQ